MPLYNTVEIGNTTSLFDYCASKTRSQCEICRTVLSEEMFPGRLFTGCMDLIWWILNPLLGVSSTIFIVGIFLMFCTVRLQILYCQPQPRLLCIDSLFIVIFPLSNFRLLNFFFINRNRYFVVCILVILWL